MRQTLGCIYSVIMKHILITAISIFLLSQSSIADNILKDTIHHSGVLTIKSDSSSAPYKDYIPWIVALLLGVSTLVLTNRQIRLSKESIDKQINTSKEIAQLELNKSVKSFNRQQWINSLRDCISEYLSLIETYKSNYENAKIMNELVGFTKNITSASEIKKLGIKIELMLNPEEEKSIIF
jgi:hypothetical protein